MGCLSIYNYFRQGWLVARLKKTLAETFDAEPLVFTLPYQAEVQPESADSGITFFIAGQQHALEKLKKSFTSPEAGVPVMYWLNRARAAPDSPDGFAQRPTLNTLREWLPFGLATVSRTGRSGGGERRLAVLVPAAADGAVSQPARRLHHGGDCTVAIAVVRAAAQQAQRKLA